MVFVFKNVQKSLAKFDFENNDIQFNIRFVYFLFKNIIFVKVFVTNCISEGIFRRVFSTQHQHFIIRFLQK